MYLYNKNITSKAQISQYSIISSICRIMHRYYKWINIYVTYNIYTLIEHTMIYHIRYTSGSMGLYKHIQYS